MKLRAISLVAGVVGLATVLAGGLCDPPPPVEEPPPDGTQAGYIEALCGWYQRCAETTGLLYSDPETCAAFMNDLFDCGYRFHVRASVFGAQLQYDESFGLECVTWIDQEATCDSLNTLPEACLRAARYHPITADSVVEVVGEGEACDVQGGLYRYGETLRICDLGLSCHPAAADGMCNLCRPPISLGEECDPLRDHCRGFCDPTTRRCVADRQVGEPCEGHSNCVPGWCRDGSCAEPLERGASCVVGDMCAGFLVCREGICTDRGGAGSLCPDGSSCQLNMTCRSGECAEVELCAPGELEAPCFGYCAEGSRCDSATNRCVALNQPGSPCAGFVYCTDNAYCDHVSSTCVLYAAIGEPCGVGGGGGVCNAYEGYCSVESSTCVGYAGVGEACSQNADCDPHRCDFETNRCSDQCIMP